MRIDAKGTLANEGKELHINIAIHPSSAAQHAVIKELLKDGPNFVFSEVAAAHTQASGSDLQFKFSIPGDDSAELLQKMSDEELQGQVDDAIQRIKAAKKVMRERHPGFLSGLL